MEHLKNKRDLLLSELPNEEEFRRMLDSLVSVYPFDVALLDYHWQKRIADHERQSE